MIVTVTSLTDPGAVRTANEDALVIGPWVACGPFDRPCTTTFHPVGPTVCAVADGLGGHTGGAVASAHVARGLAAAGPGLVDEDAVDRALRQLHLELFDLMAADARLVGMGTTVAGLVLRPDAFVWFNIGDSRVYEEDHGYLGQLSVDDSPPRDSTAGPSVVVTQCLGGTSERTGITPHVGSLRLRVPSRFLLCSDGLTDVLSLDDIERAMKASEPIDGVATLLADAYQAGAPDNLTVAVVQVVPEGGQ